MLWIIIFLLALQVRSQLAPNVLQPDPTKFYSGSVLYKNLLNINSTFNIAYPSSFISSEPPPQLVLSLLSFNHVSLTNELYHGHLINRISFNSTTAVLNFYSEQPTFVRRVGHYYLFVSSSYSSSFYSMFSLI